ncbi:MAG: 6-phosphogluconolactonase [Nitrospiraceae bacterium]
MSRAPEIHVLPDETAVATEIADFLAWSCADTLTRRPLFHLVLSGGSTPKALFHVLASPAWRTKLDWSRVRVYFADERAVPLDHADSNYGAARAALFAPLNLPDAHISRIQGERPAADAAHDYEQMIRKNLQDGSSNDLAFDVILLGIGNDGHTASLFPGGAELDERTRLVVESASPSGIRSRITMTYPLLNRGRVVLFHVVGVSKAAMVQRVIDLAGGAPPVPAARIAPTNGRLLWYLDEPAAAQLAATRRQRPSDEA